MNDESLQESESLIKQLLVPFLLSITLGIIIFYGGEAYQAMGLAALENTLAILGDALGVLEFIVLAVLLRRVVKYIVLDRIIASALGVPTPRLLSQISTVIIYTLALAAIVGVVFKQDLGVVLAACGGAGIVVGLALQGMIQDLFAGLTINLDRFINIGDYISVHKGDAQPIEGEIKEVSWRTMQILTPNGNLIIVPNSQIYSNVLTNYSVPERYFEMEVIVVLDVEIPLERATQILQTAALEVSPRFSPQGAPKPEVTVKKITLQGIEYAILIYPTFATRDSSTDLVYQHILRHLNYAGLAPAREKQENRDYQVKTSLHADIKHYANLLGAAELFQDLQEPELQLLAGASTMHKLPVGALVVQGGDVASSMFFVIEGLLVSEEWRKQISKKNVSARILGPGSLLNSTAVLAGGSYNATVRAQCQALVCEIDQSVIEQLLVQKPEAGRFLSRRVAERIRRSILMDGVNHHQTGDDIEELTAMVFKHLRRTYAHLQLI